MAIPRLGAGDLVTAAALDLGYESVAAFATMFKRVLGVAPSRYHSYYLQPAGRRDFKYASRASSSAFTVRKSRFLEFTPMSLVPRHLFVCTTGLLLSGPQSERYSSAESQRR